MNGKRQKLPVKREYSAGGCVYRRDGDSVVWLVGKHSGYRKWVLPKGLIEKGERGVETAVREVEEEMGVRARVVGERPIHKEEYWFVATLAGKKSDGIDRKLPVRRVAVYREEPAFEKSKDGRVRVFKTVTFYLMEYASGDPRNHDWEMEEAVWLEFGEANERLAFEGERAALERAHEMVGK